MTALRRPCLGWRDERCGEPAAGGRCKRHQAMADAARPSPSARGYDRPYQKDRLVTLAPVNGQRPRCRLRLPGCTIWADTADHVIPTDRGRNPLARRGPLLPACGHCNFSRGKGPLPAGALDPEPDSPAGDDKPWWPDP